MELPIPICVGGSKREAAGLEVDCSTGSVCIGREAAGSAAEYSTWDKVGVEKEEREKDGAMAPDEPARGSFFVATSLGDRAACTEALTTSCDTSLNLGSIAS